MSATFGQVGHVLTNTGHSLSTTSSTWSCVSVANNEYLYRHGTSTTYDFKYVVANDEWIDANTVLGHWPSHFGTSATDDTAITPTGSSQYLYLYDSNLFVCEIENDGYSSGSGSGGGGSFLSTADTASFAGTTPQLIHWKIIVGSSPTPNACLLYTSPSPRDQRGSGIPSCG